MVKHRQFSTKYGTFFQCYFFYITMMSSKNLFTYSSSLATLLSVCEHEVKMFPNCEFHSVLARNNDALAEDSRRHFLSCQMKRFSWRFGWVRLHAPIHTKWHKSQIKISCIYQAVWNQLTVCAVEVVSFQAPSILPVAWADQRHQVKHGK